VSCFYLFSTYMRLPKGVCADDRQPKIALKCKDTEELEILAAKARSLNLCARTIQDA
jgi:peptidyl-tRNA hydrolase